MKSALPWVRGRSAGFDRDRANGFHVAAVDADLVREDHFAHQIVLKKFECGFDFAFEFFSGSGIGFFQGAR